MVSETLNLFSKQDSLSHVFILKKRADKSLKHQTLWCGASQNLKHILFSSANKLFLSVLSPCKEKIK